MDDPIIAEGLTKTFKVPVREAGLRESVKSLFRRQFRYVEAVKEVSFRIPAGEIVGILGAAVQHEDEALRPCRKRGGDIEYVVT